MIIAFVAILIILYSIHCTCISYWTNLIIIPSTRSVYARDTVVDVLVIPSTCIRGRDIVIALLVRVCVCVSVCLSVCVSPLNNWLTITRFTVDSTGCFICYFSWYVSLS